MKTSIVISSCDAFKDCWEPMIYSIKKYWPDCPYEIFIISNYEETNDQIISFLKVGEDLGFASNLKKALKMIDCEYIIYFQEDYFIDNVVDTVSIENHIKHCIESTIDFLKIDNYTILRDNLKIKDSIYCKNPIDVKYSLDTSIAIWRKAMLEAVCVDGFTGWDFERKTISTLAKRGIKINSEIIHSKYFPQKGIKYVKFTAVCRGRWTQDGVRYLSENGFNHLIPKRKVEGRMTTFVLSTYLPHSFLRIPVSLIIKILQKLNI